MADANDIPPLRWLFGSAEERRRANQYWLRDTAQGLFNTAIHESLKALPIDACSALGAVMGRLSALKHPETDARVRRAWCALRPEQSDPASLEAAMHRLWSGIGRTMAEFSVLDRLWPAGRIAVEGLDHMEVLRAAGRPILGVWLHLGNWETIGVTCVATGHPGAAIYLPPPNRFDHRIVVRVRERYGAKIFLPGHGAMRAAARYMKEKKGLFVIFIDEIVDDLKSTPAFGRLLPTDGNIAFAARLAMMTDAEIVPAYCLRIGGKADFKVTFCSPIELLRDGDHDAALLMNIAKINAVIEPIVLAHLDQWISIVGLKLNA